MQQRRSREEMKEGFKKRMQENQNKNDGGFYANLFRKDISIPFMKCGEGYHTIDILDYIAGKNDPHPGEPSYCYEFYIYSNVGAGQGPILCLSKTFGLPDPIAEDRARKQRDGMDKKTLDLLLPSRNPRVLYNVICSDNKEEEKKGVQVFHTSSYLMEDYLREMAKGSVRPGMEGIDPLINFTDPDDGKSVKFKREGTTENTKFILHQFVDRPRGFTIPDEDLNKVLTLDELIYIPTYDELCEYYYGRGQHMPSAGSLGGGTVAEAPVAERRSRYDAPPQQTEIKTDTAKKDEPKNPCPHGHVFGVEIDKFPKECEPCSEWKPCARAKKALDENAAAKPQTEAPPATTTQPAAAQTTQSSTEQSAEGRRRRRE